MSQFILAPEAARDIEEIVRYIAKENVAAALALEDELFQSFEELAAFPNLGHTRTDLAGKRNLLFLSIGRYLVIYRAYTKEVEILAVLHGSRDVPKILRHREPGQ